jgi:hypothetical protein
MMKQFSRTMLTVMGVAVAAAGLSAIPAQASGPTRSISANGLGGSVNFVDMSNPADPVTASVNLSQTSNNSYLLYYSIADQAGTFTDFSIGSIPASSVNVSGGSVNTGKVVATLNVNTCDFAEFIANGQGPCGTLDITWTELPASVTGSFAERSNIVDTFPNGEKMVQVGDVLGFTALVSGTALNFSNTGGPAYGSLAQQKNVTKTFTGA